MQPTQKLLMLTWPDQQNVEVSSNSQKINDVRLSDHDRQELEILLDQTELKDLENLLNVINERTEYGSFTWKSESSTKTVGNELKKRGYINHIENSVRKVNGFIVEKSNEFHIWVTMYDID